MNDLINHFLAGDKFMPEMYLKQPVRQGETAGFT